MGVTGHIIDERLLLSLEATTLFDLQGFDEWGFEYRAGIGIVPDQLKSLTVWLQINGGFTVRL